MKVNCNNCLEHCQHEGCNAKNCPNFTPKKSAFEADKMKVYVVYEYSEFDSSSRTIKAFFNKEKAEKFENELYAKFPERSSIIYDIEEVEVWE